MSEKKILYMSRPDERTLKFWKATADDENEYVARIAKFSLALSGSQTQPTACSRNAGTQSERGGNVAAPGVRAKKTGKKLKRGRALQVMVYPRRKTKSVLVDAARDTDLTLSAFLFQAWAATRVLVVLGTSACKKPDRQPGNLEDNIHGCCAGRAQPTSLRHRRRVRSFDHSPRRWQEHQGLLFS